MSGADHKRRADLATIHIAAKTLFGDVSQTGDGRGDYEAWLMRHTGKISAAKLTQKERIDFMDTLRREGLIKSGKRGRGVGGNGPLANGNDRASKAQWNKIGALSRKMGWDGLEDPMLRGFVQRTAKVSDARFLDKAGATKVITGLEVRIAKEMAH